MQDISKTVYATLHNLKQTFQTNG